MHILRGLRLLLDYQLQSVLAQLLLLIADRITALLLLLLILLMPMLLACVYDFVSGCVCERE